jgi:hypothetical protein
MKTTSAMILFLLCLNFQPVKAQEDRSYRGFFFSVASGASFGSAKSDLMDGMKDSNLDAYLKSWLFTNAIKYPKSRGYPAYEIELGYYLKQKHWISAAYGINNNVEVSGYQNIGLGNSLTVRSKSSFVSVNYHFHPGEEYPVMFAGPVLMFHSFENSASSELQKNTVPGFNVGLSIRIIDKEVWFLALNSVYRWATQQTAGPFSSSHMAVIILEEPEVYTSTFKETKTSISAFVLLLTFGVNFSNIDL